MTQHQKLERLLMRKRGCTSVDICAVLPSVSPHRRLSDLKERGWSSAWGGVFAQAAREGYIRRSEQLFPRTMSNGSLRPGWMGV